jgi:serpin B
MKYKRWMLVAASLLVSLAGADLQADDRNEKAPTSASAVDEVVQANNDFALEVYDQFRSQPDPLCFSPCSMFAALSMLRSGADGLTGSQLEKGLCFSHPAENLHTGFAEAVAGLIADSENHGYLVSVENALYSQKDSRLSRGFVKGLRENYKAKGESLDFIGDSASAIRQINRHLAKQSDGRIKEMISAGNIDQLTEVVLVNVVRLKVGAGDLARRAKPFAPVAKELKEPRLHLASYDPGYRSGSVAQSDQGLSLVLFLTMMPEQGPAALGGGWQGPDAVVAFNEIQEATRTHLDLQETLEGMKVTEIFSGTCDLSRLDPANALYVASVQHSAWYNESPEGTEAVAATVIVLSVMDPVSLTLAD